jgi:hypothetical protein
MGIYHVVESEMINHIMGHVLDEVFRGTSTRAESNPLHHQVEQFLNANRSHLSLLETLVAREGTRPVTTCQFDL